MYIYTQLRFLVFAVYMFIFNYNLWDVRFKERGFLHLQFYQYVYS